MNSRSNINQTIGGSSLNANSETSIISASHIKISPRLIKHDGKPLYNPTTHPSVSHSTTPHIYITETNNKHQHERSSSPSTTIPVKKGYQSLIKKPIKLKVYEKEDIDEPLINKLSRKYKIKYPTSKTETTTNTAVSQTKLPSIKHSSDFRYTKETYLSKTREIAQLHYSLQLKKEQKLQIETEIQKEIEGINHTMKSLESYNKTFEDNVINKINASLKGLYSTLEKERLIAVHLYQQVLNQRKEMNILETKIRRKEAEKKNIERWIVFQLEVRKFGKVTNLKEELKHVEDGIIFDSVEAVEDQFQRIEKQNVRLLMQYNTKQKDLADLKDYHSNIISSRQQQEQQLNEQIIEKEKIVELLKMRYQTLYNQYRKALTVLTVVPKKKKVKIVSSLNFKLQDFAVFQLLHTKNDLLYSITYKLYNNCVNNLQNEMSCDIEVNFKNCLTKEAKLLGMLLSIELSVDYLKNKYNYYKQNKTIYGEMFKQKINQLEKEKRIQKSIQAKEIENKRYKELKEKIEAKENKKRFLPLRKIDMYPSRKFVDLNTHSQRIKVETEPEFHDFIYDSDEE